MPEIDHGYYAHNHDGGVGGTSDLGLTEDEVLAVLDGLDPFHGAALASFEEAPDA